MLTPLLVSSLHVHKTDLSLKTPFSTLRFRVTETTMEELLRGGLANSAHAKDLSFMKECAEKLDGGEELVETYSKYRAPKGLSALHYGAAGGRREICKYLIEVGGLDVNMQDWRGEIVLNHAIMGY